MNEVSARLTDLSTHLVDIPEKKENPPSRGREGGPYDGPKPQGGQYTKGISESGSGGGGSSDTSFTFGNVALIDDQIKGNNEGAPP